MNMILPDFVFVASCVSSSSLVIRDPAEEVSFVMIQATGPLNNRVVQMQMKTKVKSGSRDYKWRPSLSSIPEDRSIFCLVRNENIENYDDSNLKPVFLSTWQRTIKRIVPSKRERNSTSSSNRGGSRHIPLSKISFLVSPIGF